MKHTLTILLFLFGLTLQAAQKGRLIQDFDKNWRFFLGDDSLAKQIDFDDKSWRVLDLPHDWSIEGNFSDKHPAGTGGGALPGGIGWYRKRFNIPASSKGKSVFIDFDGIYRNSEVWVNGIYLGKRPNGYISFRYDLSEHLKYGGSNLITVRVDNSDQPNSRWYSGSGIYRSVKLITTGKVHVDNWGTFVQTPSVSEKAAKVNIQITLRNANIKSRYVKLVTKVYAPDSRLVATKFHYLLLKPGQTRIEQLFNIASAALWSTENPVLYRAVSTIIAGSNVEDEYLTPFGIRYFGFDAERGFSLNGKPMKIYGVCNHHDLGALGAAFNLRAAERQLEILKEMGCNGIRTAHNPPAPELLDLCDKMGFIVMNESFDMWKKPKNASDYSKDWDKWHKADLEDHIKRDRNHPSVFIWSVGNEIQEQWGDAAKGDTSGRNIARELVSIVSKLDTSRPIITANNEVNAWNNLIRSGAFDLIGYNYNHGAWDDFKSHWPGKKLIVTESTSALQTRGHYDLVPFDTVRKWPEAWDKPIKDGGNPDFTVSAYDHVRTPWGSTHEESLRLLEQYPHISGMYVWTGFDYLGEPTPYPWPARSSYFGIIDLAGFPKDVYYLYKSVWTDKPVLHIYPHWNWIVGDSVDVVSYYNNADEVELYLNGRSLGKKAKTANQLHVKWRVRYEPGNLKAISRRGGQQVLSKELNTAGAAARLQIVADRKTLNATGKDLSFLTVNVVDKDGNLVPTADNQIAFKVSGAGRLVAVDSGNPVSHESFKSSTMKASYGKLLGMVQTTDAPGDITIEVSAAGIEKDIIVLKSK